MASYNVKTILFEVIDAIYAYDGVLHNRHHAEAIRLRGEPFRLLHARGVAFEVLAGRHHAAVVHSRGTWLPALGISR